MLTFRQSKAPAFCCTRAVDKPQLEQLLKATSALTKASTAVHGMALWWTHLRLLLESLSNKGNNLNRPDVLGTLAAGKPKLYFTAINTRIGPNMVEMYGVCLAAYILRTVDINGPLVCYAVTGLCLQRRF